MLTTCDRQWVLGPMRPPPQVRFYILTPLIDAYSNPLAGSILSEATSAAASVFTVVTCMLLFNTLNSIF